MGYQHTAMVWTVVCWSLPPMAAETQLTPSAEDSFDTRLTRLQRIIERQQKIADALGECIDNLGLVRMRGRDVGVSNAQAPAAGAITATQSPSPVLIAQSSNTAPASESTITVRPDPSDRPRIQSKDLTFQSEHAPLFKQRFIINTGISHGYYDHRNLVLSGFLALGVVFPEQINLVQTKANVTTLDITSRYGFSNRLSADLTIPAVCRSGTSFNGNTGRASSTVSEASKMSAGLGDVGAGIYYQLAKESADLPNIVGSSHVRVPTRHSPFGIKLIHVDGNDSNLIIDQQLSIGNGVRSGMLGMSFLKAYDPVVLFANASYTYYVPCSLADIFSIESVIQPDEVKLDNTTTLGGGLALALNDHTALTMAYGTALSSSMRITSEGGAE